MENIEKNNCLESAKNRLDISGLTYLDGTKYVYDKIVPDNIDEVYKQYIPIVQNEKGQNILRYKNLMNQYYWLINNFIPSCNFYKLCYKDSELQWRNFTDYSELRGEVIIKFLDFNYKVLSVVTMLKGQILENVPTASLPGNTFNGWFTEREGGEEFDFSSTPITDDLTVFAQYTINTYIVRFVDWNGAVLEETEYEYNDNPQYSGIIHYEGHTFTGWYPELKPVTEDATYTAKYRINYYTVNYYNYVNPDISRIDYVLLYTETVPYNSPSTLPNNPTYAHFIFLNWEDESGHTVDLEHIKSDLELYPNITEKEYTVTFYNWDNTIISTQTVEYGHAAEIPQDDPERDNYTFLGWDYDTSFVDRDMAVHPIFVGVDCVVDFVLEDEDSEYFIYSSVIVPYNTAVSSPVPPRISEYDPYVYGVFDGWYNDSGETWDFTTMITGDTTIYGRWKTEFAVTFYNWDETLVTGETLSNPVYVEYGGSVSNEDIEEAEANILEKEGYEFLGWDKPFTGITKDTNLRAVFSDTKICTVTFINGNTGEVIDIMTVEFGGTIYQSDYPVPPEEEKYNFVFWDGDTMEVFDDTTVTAIYEPVDMQVHYIDAVGDPILDMTVKYLSTGVTPYNIEIEQITVNGLYPEEPYVYAVLEPTGAFCYVSDEDDLYVEPSGECINPEQMIITEDNTKFVAQYNVIETGITSYTVKFFSHDLVYFYSSTELYGTHIDTGYTQDVLEIFRDNGHGMDPNIYDFESWVDQNGNEYKYGEDTLVITENMSLTAQYEMKKADVVFHDVLSNLDINEIQLRAMINNPIDRPNYILIPEKAGYNKIITQDNNIWYKNPECTIEWKFKKDINGQTIQNPDNVDPNGVTLYGRVYEEPTPPQVYVIIYNATTDLRHHPNLATMGDGVNIIREQCTYDSETGSGSLRYDNEITEIPNNSFENIEALRSVNIPNTVTIIGEYAFFNCTNLLNVTLSNNLTTISLSAFELCVGLTNISIPNSVTLISTGAFRQCTSLRTFEFPENIEFIGDIVLLNCSGLTYIKCNAIVPPELQSVSPPMPGPHPTPSPTQAFDGTNNCPIYVPCESVEAYKTAQEWSKYSDRIQCEQQTGTILYLSDSSTVVIPDNVLTQELISDVYSDTLVACEIGDNVTEIGGGAFGGCSSLTSVTFGNSVTTIGNGAFSSCVALQSINIPSSVTSIGTQIFNRCLSLSNITVDINNTIYNDGNNSNAIIITSTNELISGCKNTIIPNTVTIIGTGAFSSMSNMSNIIIPDSVIRIKDLAFYYCIGLEEITCNATTPPTLGNNVFVGVPYTCKLYVPCESVSLYEAAAQWRDRDIQQCEGTILHLNDSSTVLIIENVLTQELISDVYKNTLVSVEIGDNVTSIGDDAFNGCALLTSIEIPNNVTSIGRYAFSNCTNLRTVVLPDNISSISTGVFSECSSLTSINIPDSVTSIGEYAFGGCTNISEITIGENVNQIGLYGFRLCNSISRVTCKASNPPTLIGDTFSSIIDVLYVKSDCIEDYENSDWASYFTHIEGY